MEKSNSSMNSRSGSMQWPGRMVAWAVMVVALAWAGAATAATCTSKASGNWGTASTWTCTAGTVPAAADTVILASPYTVTLNANYTAALLTINSGATLSDTIGSTLTVTGNITNNGTFSSTSSGILNATGAAAIISGSGIFSGSARLYTSGTAPSIAAGSNLTFAGTAQIRAGRNGNTTVAGSVLTINGTITSTQAAGTNLMRLYANSTVIGATGIISASNSTITYNTSTAKVTNNGIVNVQRITQNSNNNAWVQGSNSSLTVAAASTFGAASATTGLNATATGNTVTFNTPATPVAPYNNTYYNLAGSGVSCPVIYTILGTSPCTLPPGVFSATRSPGTCTDVAGIGTVTWATPANAQASDNAYATAANVINNVTTHYLRCINYGFAIPAGSTILGIVVSVERKTSGGTIRDAAMRTVKDVAGVATIQATDRSTATNYTTTDVIESHGGSADLWGTTWTVADINTTNFGAAVAAKNTTTSTRNRTVSVDHMPITVYYSTPNIHHLEIDHPGSGSTCSPTTVSVKACGDAACTLAGLYTGGATVTLTPGGNVVSIGATGIGSGTVSSGTSGAVTLAASSSPAAANATTCLNTVSSAASCSFTFNSASINLSVPNGVSGNNVTGTISACSGGAFTGTKTINFYTSYANPVTGTKQATINGTAIANTGTTGTAISLTFASSSASFTLSYPDVGLVTLTAIYAGTPTLSNGSASFIMKPAGFVLSNIKRTSDGALNPGATTAGGPAFVKAGEPFSVTVTAVNSAGAATPNFGQGSPPDGVKLTAALRAGLGLTNVPSVNRQTTGSIVSGSKALSAASITGYAVGDNIRVVGAGVGGADLYSTISAIPGTGGFTLTTAASTTVSGANVRYSFGAFTNGVATGTNFAWDEVGIITLLPSIADGSYMTAGDVSGDLSGNPSGPVGRFTLAKFKLQSQTQDDRADLCQDNLLVADDTTPCDPSFTYMGEEIDTNFTLVPLSLNNVAVQNYTGNNGPNDFAKLDPTTSFSNLNLAAVDRATAGQPYYLTPRISNAGMLLITCNSSPCFDTTGADISVPFMLSRKTPPPVCANPAYDGTCPDGDYMAVDFGIALQDADGAPIDAVVATGTGTCNNPSLNACYDLDTDATAGNDHVHLGTTQFRFGRMKIANALGSAQLPLTVTMAAEYWDGAAFVSNVDDDLTSLLTTNIVLGTYRRNGTDAWTTSVSAVSGTGTAMWQATLAKPAGAFTGRGSVDVSVNGFSYLPSNNPPSRATFGVFKGANEFIYLRENY